MSTASKTNFKRLKKLSVKDIVFILMLPLLLLIGTIFIIIFRHELWQIFKSSGNIRLWVQDWGIWAPLAFVGLQIIQVVIFIIPGEITQIAGGVLFGPWGGFFYSSLGIAIGSIINFYLARLLGKGFVHALFKKESCDNCQKGKTSSN